MSISKVVLALLTTLPLFAIHPTASICQTSWEPTGRLPEVQGTIINLAANKQGNVFAVSREIKIGTGFKQQFFRSTDNGTSWEHLSDSIGTVAVGSDGTIWAGTFNGLFRSPDKGETWLPVILPSHNETAIWTITTQPDGTIAAITGAPPEYRFYISRDNGTSWYWVDADATALSESFCLYDNGNRLYTASGVQGYTHYTFAPESKAYHYSGFANELTTANIEHYIHRIIYSGQDGLLFLTSSIGDDAMGDRVSRSSDGGTTWQTITPHSNVFAASLLVTTDGKPVVATKSNGVFISSDNGDHWQNISSGLPQNYTITAATENQNNGLFVAITSASGTQVLRATSTSGVEDADVAEQKFSLRAWPTHSDHSTVQYTLPSADHISLTIYDPLGRTVRSLVHDMQSVGTYSAFWDGNDDRGVTVSHGVYLIVLQTSKGSSASTMTIVR